MAVGILPFYRLRSLGPSYWSSEKEAVDHPDSLDTQAKKRLTTRFVPRAATTAQIGPTQNFYGNGSPPIRGFVIPNWVLATPHRDGGDRKKGRALKQPLRSAPDAAGPATAVGRSRVADGRQLPRRWGLAYP